MKYQIRIYFITTAIVILLYILYLVRFTDTEAFRLGVAGSNVQITGNGVVETKISSEECSVNCSYDKAEKYCNSNGYKVYTISNFKPAIRNGTCNYNGSTVTGNGEFTSNDTCPVDCTYKDPAPKRTENGKIVYGVTIVQKPLNRGKDCYYHGAKINVDNGEVKTNDTPCSGSWGSCSTSVCGGTKTYNYKLGQTFENDVVGTTKYGCDAGSLAYPSVACNDACKTTDAEESWSCQGSNCNKDNLSGRTKIGNTYRGWCGCASKDKLGTCWGGVVSCDRSGVTCPGGYTEKDGTCYQNPNG